MNRQFAMETKMKTTSFTHDDSFVERSPEKNDSLFRLKVVLLVSILANIFLLIWCWCRFDADWRQLHGEPVQLTSEMVSLDYRGTTLAGTTNQVDRFVLSNHLDHSVFTYDPERGFQQAIYVSGSGRVSRSEDFSDVSGEELSSALIEIPPGRVWSFELNRCDVDLPWKLRREILFSDSYDPSYLFFVETAFVHSNQWIR